MARLLTQSGQIPPERTMELVLSSFLAIIVVVALVVKGPYRGLWVFCAVTPLGAAAAINLPAVGGASFLVVDIAAMAMFGLVAMNRGGLSLIAGAMRIGQPGFWIALLLVFGTFATLMFPTVFAGKTEVFSLSRAVNDSGIISIQLRPSSGNLTQLFRLFLGVATFFALATVFRVRPDGRMIVTGLIVATSVNAALGWLDVATYAVGMPEILDPIRSANYAILFDVRMAGMKRMIGGFPEASSFGYFSLGLFGFWLQYWLDTPKSRLVPVMLAIAAIAVLRSTSSASYVAMLVFLVTMFLMWLADNLRRQTDRRGFAIAVSAVLVAWLATIAIFAGYEYIGAVQGFLDRALFDKLGGASGVERLGWNAQALQNFVDTGAMGAGLGSVRASSWIMATLASLGVIGTSLFILFIASVLYSPSTRRVTDDRLIVVRALRAACIALLISANLTGATPDLGLFFFACAGLAAGLNRGVILDWLAHKHSTSGTTAQIKDNPTSSAPLSPRDKRHPGILAQN